jgi:hypothetical protein
MTQRYGRGKIMSTKTRLKFAYRQPSFLEGVSRVFDVLGTFNDDVKFYSIRASCHHTKGGSDDKSVSVIGFPESIGTKAIGLAFRKIHRNMEAVASRMRPSIPSRNHQSIFK